jgi:hypothetical protein
VLIDSKDCTSKSLIVNQTHPVLQKTTLLKEDVQSNVKAATGVVIINQLTQLETNPNLRQNHFSRKIQFFSVMPSNKVKSLIRFALNCYQESLSVDSH